QRAAVVFAETDHGGIGAFVERAGDGGDPNDPGSAGEEVPGFAVAHRVVASEPAVQLSGSYEAAVCERCADCVAADDCGAVFGVGVAGGCEARAIAGGAVSAGLVAWRRAAQVAPRAAPQTRWAASMRRFRRGVCSVPEPEESRVG